VVAPSGSTRFTNLPDSLRDRMAALTRLTQHPRQFGSGTKSYLVETETVRTASGTWKIIAARSLQPGNLLLGQLGLTLILGAAVLFVTFGVTSWILSGVALRPVSRMRKEAENLGDLQSTGTLPIGPARDELAALARTLNDFIERNRASVDRERQMLSDASHELRTPIAVLIAQLEEADATPRALATAQRLSRLATNLLELSKLEATQTTGSSSWRELGLELAASTDRARTLALPRDVSVDFDFAGEDDGASYRVSASSFGRLIDNLFSNAITASPDAGIVHARLTQSPRGLALVVRDHGPGVPEKFIPVAFDRFTRPDEARGRDDGGSGLGLAIVAAIVSQADGTVAMRNRRPGLEVTAELPAVRSD
jgi:two-component system OmpR family sensor kinase